MAGHGPHVVLEDLIPRLKAAARAVADTRDAHEAALELRKALVVRAVDQGTSQQAIADAIGVRKGRISAILASSQPDLEGE